MKSLWKDIEMPRFQALEGDRRTDVLIIGGGLFGILTAHFLQKKGIPYILCEKDRICEKSTGNTTAKLTVQHGTVYSRLMESVGVEKTQMYYRANEEALSEYYNLCKCIDCDFEIKDNCIYSTDDRKALENELKALEAVGADAFFKEDLPIPVRAVGGVYVKDQAQLHPLKFLSNLAKDLKVFENTFITRVSGKRAYYPGGTIEAERIVVATHFPFINKYGGYFLKLYQNRSFVVALENAEDVCGMYMDANPDGFSFRNHGDLLLVGGMSHKTGDCKRSFERLSRFARELYPSSVERYAWAAQDCMSLDGIPYIGRYSRISNRLYTATGFNKWGMTSAMAAALIISSELSGEEKDYAQVFSPSRSILKPQLYKNIASSAKNLLTPSKKRCSHMGCALKWNSEEGTWECPCHGSVFSGGGKVIENPSNKRLR